MAFEEGVFFERLPIPAVETSVQGRITGINRSARRFLQMDSAGALQGRPVASAVFHSSSRKAVRGILQSLRCKRSPILCEGLRVITARSVVKDVLVQAGPSPGAIPRSSRILFAIMDMTCFSESIRRFIEADSKWESLIASAPDIIVIIDRKGIIQFINRSADGTVAQVLGRPIYDFVIPKDRAIARRAIRRVFTSGQNASYEAEGITPGGKVGSYAMRVAPVKRDKKTTAALLIARDISAQKEVEEKLQLHLTHLGKLVEERTSATLEANARLRREIEQRKSVAARLLQSQERLRALSRHLQLIAEKEKTSLARDIHDEMGAALMRLKFTVDSLTEGDGGDAHFRQVKGELSSQIQKTMDEIRSLIARLRPPILDEIGVAAAIIWEARIFEQKSKIKCQVGDISENPGLAEEKATALFRVFQELLTNIGRHSAATEVEIRLVRHKGLVSLRVSDNGCGIRPAAIGRSLGLVGIRERLDGLGGRFRIFRRKEGGTCAEAFLPIDEKP